MLKNLFILFCFSVLQPLTSYGQTAKTEFPDGIYLSIEALKAKQPDILYKQLYNKKTGEQPTDFTIENQQIFFINKNLQPDSILTNNVFGYAELGLFYLVFTYQKKIYAARSIRMGKVWQFATMVTSNTTAFDPSPFSRYNNYQRTVTTQSLMQLILNTTNGDVKPLKPESLLMFMTDDEEISKEYKALSGRKKKKELYSFINKYNTKYPLAW